MLTWRICRQELPVVQCWLGCCTGLAELSAGVLPVVLVTLVVLAMLSAFVVERAPYRGRKDPADPAAARHLTKMVESEISILVGSRDHTRKGETQVERRCDVYRPLRPSHVRTERFIKTEWFFLLLFQEIQTSFLFVTTSSILTSHSCLAGARSNWQRTMIPCSLINVLRSHRF